MKKTTLALLSLSLMALQGCFFVPVQRFEAGSDLYRLANPELKLSTAENISAQSARHRVLVAVIDSGVDYNHTQLQKNLHYFAAPNGEQQLGLDVLGADPLPFPIIVDPKTGEIAEDITGEGAHGTHVAGLATLGGSLRAHDGATIDAGSSIGLLPIRVLPLDDEGIADTDSDPFAENPERDKIMAKKIVDVLERAMAFAAVQKADVANLSLGIEGDKLAPEAQELLKQEFGQRLYGRMVQEWQQTLFVFAAGNEKSEVSEQNYPASLRADNTLTVGALHRHDSIAEYSNFGDKVDVYIRGSDINSTVPDNLRAPMSGTSMATPLVANLALKIKLLAPCLSAAQVKAVILASSIEQELVVEKTQEKRRIKVARFKQALELAGAHGKTCGPLL